MFVMTLRIYGLLTTLVATVFSRLGNSYTLCLTLAYHRSGLSTHTNQIREQSFFRLAGSLHVRVKRI